MFSTLLLAIAMINYGSSNVSSTYTFSQDIEFKSCFNDSYYNDGYTFSLDCELHLFTYYEFNDASDYQLTVTSTQLITTLTVYDGENIDGTYSYNSTIASSFVLPDGAHPKDFLLTPASTPQGFGYRYSFDNSNKGYFFISDMEYDIDFMHQFKFSSGALNGYRNLVSTIMINNNEYSQGYGDGYTFGNSEGYNQGYGEGYAAGYTEANNSNPTASVIFSGIISIGLMPINFFLAVLNFEVFGINIGAFVSALLTVAIIVIIIKIIVGSGVNGGDGK